MLALLIHTTNERLKHYEGRKAELKIQQQVFFGSLYTSRLKNLEYLWEGLELTIKVTTLNSTYIFEVLEP